MVERRQTLSLHSVPEKRLWLNASEKWLKKIPGSDVNVQVLLNALKACSRTRDLERGRQIHAEVVEHGHDCNTYIVNALTSMYAKCGSMVDACKVFDGMKHPDVVSWNVLILGYADNGQGHTALKMFYKMRTEGADPDSVTLLAAIKACTSLAVKEGACECSDWGKEIHNFAVENGCNSHIYVQNALLDMYTKCGSMVDARETFDGMKYPDVVSWTALILGYADAGQGKSALDIFDTMRIKGPAPDSVTLVAALKACACLGVEGSSQRTECRDRAKEIHNMTMESGSIYVLSTLVDMYAKFGDMLEARVVFDSMRQPNVISWTALIMGYADNGQGRTALALFTRMRSEGPAPDSITFGAALKACGLVGALEFGKKIHSELKSCNELDVALVNCLIDFYAKCGSLCEAQRIFYLHSKTRDMITWIAFLAGFSSCGDNEAVFKIFEGMQNAGFRPDSVTLLHILTCCNHSGLVVKGKECFDSMFSKYGVVPTIKHYTCMIDLFGRANKLDDAMIMLNQMPCSPDEVTWRTILSACRKWKNLEIGSLAFHALTDLNAKDATAYVLMGQIYRSRGMLQDEDIVMGLIKKSKAYEKSGETCWTNEAGHVHSFMFGDSQHPQIHEICEKWESMGMMRQHGYTINLQNTPEVELCGHSERLALVCALINTDHRRTVRIVKNQRVCDDCHNAIAITSKLEYRSIICRDSSRIHVFSSDGKCSCGDVW